MKKVFCAASVMPSILIASGMVFASSNGGLQLSEVDDTIQQVIQEQKEFQNQVKPGQIGNHGNFPGGPQNGGPGGNHGGPGGNNGGPGGNNGHQPPPPPPPGGGNGHQPPPPPPPPAVDTTAARNAGLRDGAAAGEREGRHAGYRDGIEAGEREGRRRGTQEGDVNGRQAGYRDGYGVDQSMGTQRGYADGQTAGTSNGTQAGQKRCYDAGYTAGYNSAYAPAKQQGLQDAASFNAGYAKGQAEAQVIEAGNGQKAGYQAGFSLRETELQSAAFDAKSMQISFSKSVEFGSSKGYSLEQAQKGYTTPEEQRAYQQAYREAYDRSYRREYEEGKRRGFDERFQLEYRRAYDYQFSISYRDGFASGKEQGYQEAYNNSYNSAYNSFFDTYSRMEYAEQRAQGLSTGQAVGGKEGFAAGCAEQTRLGYKTGYEKTAAAVYPGAFAAGKQAGIAAADKFYGENAVVKSFNVSFYDEDGDGQFEAGENVMLKAELRNFGFQASEPVSVAVKSDRGEILMAQDLKAGSVTGRARSVVTLKVGRLYDVVAPDSDALTVTFSAQGQQAGDYRQVYTRTNANKVAVVADDEADITKKATWFFPGKITSVRRGEKVIVIGQDGSYYKVRKAEFGAGSWTEGFIKSDKVTLQ